jgi:hypothetical protein
LAASSGVGTRFHAIHEAAHALVGYRLGLTLKTLLPGKTSMGTSGGTEFCSQAALNRNPDRWLVIAVAGKMGTQVLGYRNRLISENLAELEYDEEPGWNRDEMRVWENNTFTPGPTPRSKELLSRYRRGELVGEECPLKKALLDNN